MADGTQLARPATTATEPVAVVGLGCRFADNVDSPEAFWDLLLSGRATTSNVPDERWQAYRDMGSDYAAALRCATRWGAFLPDIGGFDAEFFGLTPREAELMDPQQRILLEVAWEALEHAGIPPRDLSGDDVGVFVGIGSDDYGRKLLEDLPRIEAWTGIGAAMCAVANRISYALDLRGPSIAVDTACSASLVAVHLACQSLRLKESTMALAGGVNLIVSPGLTITLDAAGAMAQDGRCKSFDVTADGYGRGEGCGVIVLKRLSDAQRDGDRILALIRGSAVNQDGRTNGIMAPSKTAQEHVLGRACRQAGIMPESIDYVEAHGTGTRLGDPLEASALGTVYGSVRSSDRPCLIGSVKSNIGHLEAAAGIASIIKTVLALEHATIPPSLNFSIGNPAIDWDTVGLRVVVRCTDWPQNGMPRRAGVSAFGFGGTIAHAVLEQAPDQVRIASQGEAHTASARDHENRLFPLSAGSETALQQQAGRLSDWLSGPGHRVPLSSVGHTLALRRSHLDYRATVVASGRKELIAKLLDIANGEPSPEVVTATTPSEHDAGLVWVFSGHGSQWPGMGRELLATEPAFAAAINELEPIFREEIGFSPRQILVDGDFTTVDRIQTMTFVMQLGLADVWNYYGVTPDVIIGHSSGEIAAAVISGALSRQDGARLICRRSRLLRRVAGKGAMVMAPLPFNEVLPKLEGRDGLNVAVFSSPVSTVIAGDIGAVEALQREWQAEGVPLRRVSCDVAFHSPHMDPLVAEIIDAARDLSPRTPRVPMYTTALEDPRSTPTMDGYYWAANLRKPVRLSAAIQAAAEDGHRDFLEISAHPLVAHSIGETLSEGGFHDAFVGSSLRRGLPECATLLTNVGAVHCRGLTVNWAHLQPAGDLVTLPQIAWQHRRYWRDSTTPGRREGPQHGVDSHTLLGAQVPVAGQPMRLWRTLLEESSRPYPGSHTINGVEIVPAAVLINTCLQAAAKDGKAPALADVTLQLPLAAAEQREVQILHHNAIVRISSRAQDDTEPDQERTWLTHTMAAVVSHGAPDIKVDPFDSIATAVVRPGMEQMDPDIAQRHLASVGVPAMGFDWTIEELQRGKGTLLARVRVKQPENASATWAPALDAAVSAAPVAFPGDPVLRMAAHIDKVQLTGTPPETLLIEVTVSEACDDAVEILLADTCGHVVGYLTGLRYAVIDRNPASAANPQHLVHELVWRSLELPTESENTDLTRNIVLVAPDAKVTDPLREQMETAGVVPLVIADPEELEEIATRLDASTDVLVLPPYPSPDVPVAESTARSAWLLIRIAQSLAALDVMEFPRLWCLTQGVAESRQESHLSYASLWGLGRVISGEHPELWGGVVDLDPDEPGKAVCILLSILRAALREEVIVVRRGAASVARLARPYGNPTSGPMECQPDGTYLITGGLGVLGLEAARWLVDRGAKRLVLAGRRPFPNRTSWDRPPDMDTRRKIEGIRALEARGVTVQIVSLDISNARQAAQTLTSDALGLPPIRGIVHAAGVLDNRLLSTVDEESLRTVLRPKVDGAWVLHKLFPPGSLDFLVLFSSCGHLLALPGQASYGSANAFLDALATHRRSTGYDDTLSLGWTSWRGKGMAVNEVVNLELRARGVTDISADEALSAWDLAQRYGSGYFAVLGTAPLEPDVARLPVLHELYDDTDVAVSDHVRDLDGFADLPPEERHIQLLDEVGNLIATEMRLSTSNLNLNRSLTEQGLDSVMTLVIRRRLEKRFGHNLPATLLWNQPTASAIAGYLANLLASTE